MINNQDVLVRCMDAERSFGDGVNRTLALAPATFMVYRGNKIALVGASGSGKSTLLGLVAGLDRPSAGTITWPGLELLRNRPTEIAIAFQAPSLIPSLNVLENTCLPALLAGLSQTDAERAARAALGLFEVGALAEKLPFEVSAGQAQRVVLARAVAAQPRLLLADEPTGQLDGATGLSVIQALLHWVQSNECALVVATHDPDVAALVGTIWTMDHGKLRSASQV